MSAITSKISIASNALLLLGHAPISSFDEPGSGVQAAANLYEISYLSLLKTYRWHFATKKALLPRLAEEPLNEFKYQFQLPNDYLYIVKTEPRQDYEIYEDRLYSNHSTVSIDYTSRVEEDNLPADFILAFQYYLAMQFAVPVTGNTSRSQFYEQAYEKAIKLARFNDASQRPSNTFIDSPYIDVRS